MKAVEAATKKVQEIAEKLNKKYKVVLFGK